MLDTFQKKAPSSTTNDTHVPDFSPYACHYDANTLLTKNGELLQTLKIGSLNHHSIDESGAVNLRDNIREFLRTEEGAGKIRLWINAMRQNTDFTFQQNFENTFSKTLNEEWIKTNKWKSKYSNELYITIAHPSSADLIDYSNPLRYYFVSASKKLELEKLQKAHVSLTHLIDKLAEHLRSYSPQKLGIKALGNGESTSEMLNFIGRIVHLKEFQNPLQAMDLSKQLTKHKITFQQRNAEIKEEADSFYCAIFTLKDSSAASDLALDRFLNINAQTIITETLQVVDAKEALRHLKYQDYILQISGAQNLRTLLVPANPTVSFSGKNLFTQSQTTVSVIAPTLESLHQECMRVTETLGSLGIPSVKEDINLEDCFWSQLPGNFRFLTRSNLMPLSRSANFASTQNVPAGKPSSTWGHPISILETSLSTPYFFNFHGTSNPHTIIIGENIDQKRALLNFLISESTALNTKTLYLDCDKGAQVFANASGGVYKIFSLDQKLNQLKVNPLLLPDGEENRKFLRFWFMLLADKYKDPRNLEQYLKACDSAVEQVFKLPKEKRNLRYAAEFFSNKEFMKINKTILTRMGLWISSASQYSHVFDNASDDLQSLDTSKMTLFCIDISEVHNKDMHFSLPLIVYLLFFFKSRIAQTGPGILAVAEANNIFNNSYFEQNLESILDDLYVSNSSLVLSGSYDEQYVNWNKKVAEIYNKKMDTKIFTIDGMVNKDMAKLFDLSVEEQKLLKGNGVKRHKILLKQYGDSCVLKFNMNRLEKLYGILAGKKQIKKVVNVLMAANGTDPINWLEQLLKQ